MLIAKRYAQAFLNLFDLSQQDLHNIHKAIQFLKSHAQVLSLLKVPLLDNAIKANALHDYLIDQFKLPVEFKKLITLLIAHKRSYLIIDILKYMEELSTQRQGIEFFTIKSSTELDKKSLEAIRTFLSRKTNHTVICEPVSDARLIGGIRMQSANHLWEYSVRKQLAALQAQLKD